MGGGGGGGGAWKTRHKGKHRMGGSREWVGNKVRVLPVCVYRGYLKALLCVGLLGLCIAYFALAV